MNTSTQPNSPTGEPRFPERIATTRVRSSLLDPLESSISISDGGLPRLPVCLPRLLAVLNGYS